MNVKMRRGPLFRASEIGSEETLPLIGALAQADIDEDVRIRSKLMQQGQRHSLPPNYGIAGLRSPIKYKYPIAVCFVLATKFFEAFAANGIRTVLALYLRDDINFTESFSTTVLHIFNFFGQFTPIFGAIIADSYMGNVRTINSFCFLYAGGWILLVMTSLPNMGVSMVFLVSISLLFVAIGNGSIRACITSLGALQFKLPEQATHLAEYFSFYYFVYYFGIFLSKILPPLIRSKTSCFGKVECYPAVFATLGGAFTIAWIIFLFGKFFYKSEKLADDNILLKFYGCIKTAIVEKWRNRKTSKRPKYWLHNAVGFYEESFVDDVSKVLRISKLFIPLPIYFALLAQQDSSWTFQATLMNMTIFGITLQPDQAKAMGPIFLFMLIPLWQYICAPLLKRAFGWELKPLHSVTVGGICASLSFICAGLLQEHLTTAPFKTVSIAWQMPQFLLMMMAELLLSIPGLQFAFTQAPHSMKSVVTAAWFLNNAFGNLIVVITTQLDVYSSQTAEYLFYAVMMLISIIIFTLLAYEYLLHERSGNYYARNVVLSTDNADEQQPLLESSITSVDTIEADEMQPSTSRSASI